MKKLIASVMLAGVLVGGGFAAPAMAAKKVSDTDSTTVSITKVGNWPHSDTSTTMVGNWPH
ncbi:hypothetical protein GCM10027402_02680 [Arthrobacter monumenti]